MKIPVRIRRKLLLPVITLLMHLMYRITPKLCLLLVIRCKTDACPLPKVIDVLIVSSIMYQQKPTYLLLSMTQNIHHEGPAIDGKHCTMLQWTTLAQKIGSLKENTYNYSYSG